MGFGEALEEVYRRLLFGGEYGRWLWPAIFLLFGLLCLFWLIRALYNRRKRQWSMAWFGAMCTAVFVWSVGAFEIAAGQRSSPTAFFTIAEWLSRTALPCLLHLHLWKQVSHKVLTPLKLAANFAVPAAVIAFFFYDVTPVQNWAVPVTPAPAWMTAYYAYSALYYALGLRLCLSVFYQMPKHMRKSACYMVAGIVVMSIGSALTLFEGELAPYHLPMLVTGLGMHFFYEAQFANKASNVIATSRDFVFSNLSTMVLVLGEDARILDWNRERGRFLELLPEPKFRERFASYRSRVIREGNGQVSPHVDSILLLNYDGRECQFLTKTNAIQNERTLYGYVVEISEITMVYDVLRLFEDIATVDNLTGLMNRNAYLADAQRFVDEGAAPLCVVVGDVNHLKRVNDTLGHLVGDRLLTSVSGHIRENLPQRARAYRIGGDEFVVLMPKSPLSLAEAFIGGVDKCCAATQDEQFGTPGISWGYAMWENTGAGYNDVFSAADKMMYAQKKERHQFTSSGIVPFARSSAGPVNGPES